MQLDLEEMSKHQVYQKYAYMSVKEIREAMLDTSCTEDPELKDTGNTQLDLEDINMLQSDCGSSVQQDITNTEKQIFTSMVIVRAPPGSTIQNLRPQNDSYTEQGFDNILSKSTQENGQQLQLLISSKQSQEVKNTQKFMLHQKNDAQENLENNLPI